MNNFNNSGKYFEIFDVYNNAFTLGGKLRMISDQKFIIAKNKLTESALQKTPKLENRKDFSDVTVRVGLIVRI